MAMLIQKTQESLIANNELNKKEYYNEETNTTEVRSETIGKILKFLRKKFEITQSEIATRIGVAQQTYAGYESGKHEPSVEIIIRIADIYNLPLDYITGRYLNDKYGEFIKEKRQERINTMIEESLEHFRIQREQDEMFIKMILKEKKESQE